MDVDGGVGDDRVSRGAGRVVRHVRGQADEATAVGRGRRGPADERGAEALRRRDREVRGQIVDQRSLVVDHLDGEGGLRLVPRRVGRGVGHRRQADRVDRARLLVPDDARHRAVVVGGRVGPGDRRAAVPRIGGDDEVAGEAGEGRRLRVEESLTAVGDAVEEAVGLGAGGDVALVGNAVPVAVEADRSREVAAVEGAVVVTVEGRVVGELALVGDEVAVAVDAVARREVAAVGDPVAVTVGARPVRDVAGVVDGVAVTVREGGDPEDVRVGGRAGTDQSVDGVDRDRVRELIPGRAGDRRLVSPGAEHLPPDVRLAGDRGRGRLRLADDEATAVLREVDRLPEILSRARGGGGELEGVSPHPGEFLEDVRGARAGRLVRRADGQDRVARGEGDPEEGGGLRRRCAQLVGQRPRAGELVDEHLPRGRGAPRGVSPGADEGVGDRDRDRRAEVVARGEGARLEDRVDRPGESVEGEDHRAAVAAGGGLGRARDQAVAADAHRRAESLEGDRRGHGELRGLNPTRGRVAAEDVDGAGVGAADAIDPRGADREEVAIERDALAESVTGDAVRGEERSPFFDPSRADPTEDVRRPRVGAVRRITHRADRSEVSANRDAVRLGEAPGRRERRRRRGLTLVGDPVEVAVDRRQVGDVALIRDGVAVAVVTGAQRQIAAVEDAVEIAVGGRFTLRPQRRREGAEAESDDQRETEPTPTRGEGRGTQEPVDRSAHSFLPVAATVATVAERVDEGRSVLRGLPGLG